MRVCPPVALNCLAGCHERENNDISYPEVLYAETHEIQSDPKLLSEFPWPINGNTDNNLESLSMYFPSIKFPLNGNSRIT
jgi:hypothetical protein